MRETKKMHFDSNRIYKLYYLCDCNVDDTKNKNLNRQQKRSR